MAKSMTSQKKHILGYMSGLVQNKLWKNYDLNSKSSSESENSSIITMTSENYSTWPSSNLEKTIANFVLSSRNSSSKWSLSTEEIEKELDTKCPWEIDEQLDFCMLCHETNHMEAVNIQKQLCSGYGLLGKVVWDCIPLGRDIFSVFDNVVNNSTKLLFYLTEQFDDSDACAHVARNLLMAQTEGTSGKVIPIVNDFNSPIPETFKLVDKLYLCSKLQFQYRFPAVFTEEVRNEKVLRTKNVERNIDKKRSLILQDIINQYSSPK